MCHSLDSSDNGITTTAGPPTHSTKRYSAPEVFNHEPRNRLTDIWSLGCVLSDIVSCLQGYNLATMKSFWLSNGAKYDSYAENSDATVAWLEMLASNALFKQDVWLIFFIKEMLLEPDRLLRPTAAQVLERLGDVYLPSGERKLIGTCCSQSFETTHSMLLAKHKSSTMSLWLVGLRKNWTHMPDTGRANIDGEVLFLDINLRVLVCEDYLSLRWGISQCLDELKTFNQLRTVVQFLLRENPNIPTQAYAKWPQPPTFKEFFKSLCISCPSQMEMAPRIMPLRLGSETPRWFTVQVMLMTLQLERHPMHGAPFVTVFLKPMDVSTENTISAVPPELIGTADDLEDDIVNDDTTSVS